MEDFLKNLIREAGAMAKQFFNEGISKYNHKNDPDDIVTHADIAVSKFIVDTIHAQYPGHEIQSEEMKENINPGAEYKWVIDPIDGTRNFAAGIPLWGIIIALLKNGDTMLAAVYLPVSDQLFFAKKGEGGYLNNKKLTVSKTAEINYSFGVLGKNTRLPHVQEMIKTWNWLNTNTTARTGSYGTVIMVCFLAAGKIDFVISNGGMDHDYLAPVLIAREAGAVVTDITGQPWAAGRHDVIVANPVLHKKMFEAFNTAISK